MGHCIQRQSHTDEAVANETDARIDRAPVALAPKDCLLLDHDVRHVRLADLGSIERHAKLLSKILGHTAG